MQKPLRLRQNDIGLVAWSPLPEEPFLLARGSLVDVPEDSQLSEEIEILRLDPLSISESLTSKPFVSLGKLETGVTLNCLDWSPGFSDATPRGILSGAFGDGSLVLLDVHQLIEKKTPNNTNVLEEEEEEDLSVLCSYPLYETQEFYCMEYNHFRPTLLATGGSDIYIVNFDRSLEDPEVFSPYPPSTDILKGSKVTCISWNKNKAVQHILASACDNGRISIFDLKTKKAIFSLSDQKENVRGRNVSIQWNASIATQLAIAFDDDTSGVQIWDLRNSKAPVKILDRDIIKRVHSLDWTNKAEMLLSDFQGTVITYNVFSDQYNTVYQAEKAPCNISSMDPFSGNANPEDVFKNLGENNIISEEVEKRCLFAKCIPGMSQSFYMVNDHGDLTASFGDRKQVSSLASKHMNSDVHLTWKKGLSENEGLVVATPDVQVFPETHSHFVNNEEGQNLHSLCQKDTNNNFDSEELSLVERLRECSNDWWGYLQNKDNGLQAQEILKEKLKRKGLDSVLLDLVEKVGSTWEEKLPVLGINQKETIHNTEKVTGYKYLDKEGQENDQTNDLTSSQKETKETGGVCEFVDISGNEAEDFFSNLAKTNEITEKKLENSVTPGEPNTQSERGTEFDKLQDTEMEREVTLVNRDWSRGLELLIKQNVLINNYEGAIDCAIKANRYFEGFLIAYSHPSDSQALIQKTLEKISQRHNEDFVYTFLKPLFKKDYMAIIEKYNLEDWQEALSFIVYNLEDVQTQTDCLALLKSRIVECLKHNQLGLSSELASHSERFSTQRREVPSMKAVLPSETLLYLELFQNDIQSTVNHLVEKLENLKPENCQALMDVIEYLLFFKTFQQFELDNEIVTSVVMELSKILAMISLPNLAYFLLDTLGNSNDFQIQKQKQLIWSSLPESARSIFSPPVNPRQALWFPRQSYLRPTSLVEQPLKKNSKFKMNRKNKIKNSTIAESTKNKKLAPSNLNLKNKRKVMRPPVVKPYNQATPFVVPTQPVRAPNVPAKPVRAPYTKIRRNVPKTGPPKPPVANLVSNPGLKPSFKPPTNNIIPPPARTHKITPVVSKKPMMKRPQIGRPPKPVSRMMPPTKPGNIFIARFQFAYLNKIRVETVLYFIYHFFGNSVYPYVSIKITQTNLILLRL